ncbi:hypothetical protein ABPG74_001596 [Tetrahymena malaccensis]
MSQQLSKKNALNDIVNLFLDEVAKQPSQIKLNTESVWNSECDSCCLKEINQQKQQDSCFQSFENDQESTKENEDYDYFEGRGEFKLKYSQQQNIIKNILKSFLSHLNKLQDSITIKKYQQIYSKQSIQPYSEIKKAVSKKINIKANRWNFQLKSLLQSKSLKFIFYDYLVNYSQQWLQKSKVSDQEEHQRLINAILDCIGNDSPLNIKIYKKKK